MPYSIYTVYGLPTIDTQMYFIAMAYTILSPTYILYHNPHALFPFLLPGVGTLYFSTFPALSPYFLPHSHNYVRIETTMYNHFNFFLQQVSCCIDINLCTPVHFFAVNFKVGS